MILLLTVLLLKFTIVNKHDSTFPQIFVFSAVKFTSLQQLTVLLLLLLEIVVVKKSLSIYKLAINSPVYQCFMVLTLEFSCKWKTIAIIK